MRNRVILHSDMNSFYASVEMMLYPELRGKAVAVCGSAKTRHGIILAKSEKAKKAGVKTGMPNYQALQVCPDLILRAAQYDEYVKFSRAAREIYGRYTDYIEPFGMDEAWLDVTDSAIYGSGTEIAEEIRQSMKNELGLTVSIGVSFNKIFAKLGSDMKKPDAVTVITPENFRTKVWPLKVEELLYAGRASTRKLNSVGIQTIGDLALADEKLLKTLLGVHGPELKSYAAGTDMSRVMHRDTIIPPKSIGHGVTCIADLKTPEEVYRVMLELSQDVAHRLRAERCLAGGVELTIRGSDLGFTHSQMPLPQLTRSPVDITAGAFELYMRQHAGQDVRQVTVTVFRLVPETEPVQEYMLVDQDYVERRDRVETAIEDLRGRFGTGIIIPASLMLEKKIPHDGRDKVRMPSPMYK